MFTGIVDHCGKIESAERKGDSLALVISCHFSNLREGESISVDGACLTTLHPEPGRFRCDLSPETLKLTVAGQYEPGRRVNLERALCVGERLGGHLVTGHVDGRCRVTRIDVREEFVRLELAGITPAHRRYLVTKGSVCVNGVSLTVNECGNGNFSVMLIPHTLERTNLSLLRAGDEVNLELDWMTKVILQAADERLTNLKASGDLDAHSPH